jgi:hypothetical protein
MSGGHLLAAGLDGGNTLMYSNPSISAQNPDPAKKTYRETEKCFHAISTAK